ncbi:MAG: Hpt domain-containing protein [Bacteroidota bacterium]
MPDDPFVVELLPEFVDTWINDMNEQFDKYIAEKNSAELYRLGHTLKGSCFQFGLDEIANMGIELMGFARNEDYENALALKPKIMDSLYEVKNFLDNEGK